MSIRKITRRLLSSAEGVWKPSADQLTGVKLGLEAFEDRIVPAFVIAAAPDANGILQAANNAAGPDNLIISTGAGGKLTVASIFGNTVTDVAGVKGINVTTTGANAIGVQNKIGDNLSGLTELRQITVTGGTGTDTVNFANGVAVTNPNIYYKIDLGTGAGQSAIVPDAGVFVLGFSTAATASNLILTPSVANSKVALDFRNAVATVGDTSAVQANLNANAGTAVATYTNMTVTLAAGKDATTIIGVYGSKGNDSLIGNNLGNILIGGEGNDTVIGGTGNDQLNVSRDFAPGMPGNKNVSGVATFDNTTVIDISGFAALSSAFTAVPGTPATAAALFAKFGFFSFGEGVAALNGTAGLNAAATAADFATANNLTVANKSADLLFGGNGNDGLYGFNNSAMTAYGQGGDDVFSSNTGALPGTYDGGDGNDLLIGAVGVTLLGGAGNDNLSFAVADVNAVQSLQSNANGGTGNDTIAAGFKKVTVDASQDTDTLNIANDASNVLVFNSTTIISGGVGAIPLVKKAQV